MPVYQGSQLTARRLNSAHHQFMLALCQLQNSQKHVQNRFTWTVNFSTLNALWATKKYTWEPLVFHSSKINQIYDKHKRTSSLPCPRLIKFMLQKLKWFSSLESFESLDFIFCLREREKKSQIKKHVISSLSHAPFSNLLNTVCSLFLTEETTTYLFAQWIFLCTLFARGMVFLIQKWLSMLCIFKSLPRWLTMDIMMYKKCLREKGF